MRLKLVTIQKGRLEDPHKLFETFGTIEPGGMAYLFMGRLEKELFWGGGGCQLLGQAFLVYLPYLAKLIKNNKYSSAGKGFICLAEGCEFVMGHSVAVI